MTANEVRDLISNDLWQNSDISSVGVNEFRSLDEAASKLTEAEEKQEFKKLCETALEGQNTNSVAVRYLTTVTGRHPNDDKHLFTVLEQYYEASKWDEVVFLAEKILSFSESPYALRVLAECYDVNKKEDKKIEVWERLVKVDYDETEILYNLADIYNKAGDTQKALNFYRNVIRRHIKAHDLTSLKNVWEKIMSMKGDNSEYLIGLAGKIADAMGPDKGVYFLSSIYDKGSFDINTRIEILKKVIKLSPHELGARDRLVELWKEKYKGNERLDFCLNNTGILQDYLNINTAIENFEKEIRFEKKAFVYHDTWKLGRIMEINKDDMDILFLGKGQHKMSCSLAFSSLKVLPKNHLLVLKAALKPEDLKKRFFGNDPKKGPEEQGVAWGLKTLLFSLGGQASLKQMKAELVTTNNTIFSDKEWSEWSSLAKKELSVNPYFGISDNSIDVFTLRTTPISFEEKTLSIFKSTKEFYGKLKVMKDFIKAKGQTDSDEFSSMVQYFETKSQSRNEEGLCAYLILQDLKEKQNMSFINLYGSFTDYYSSVKDIKKFFNTIEDSELKKKFIDSIKDNIQNYQDILVELYPSNMTGYMSDYIKGGPRKGLIGKILAKAAVTYKDDPDFFLYLEKTFDQKEWGKAKVTAESLLITKLQLLSFVNRKIENSSDVTENKKRQKMLQEKLFSKDKEAYTFILNSDEYQAQKIYSIIRGMTGCENEKLTAKHIITQKFENWEAIIGENPDKALDRKNIIPKGLLCTQAMLDAKAAELDHIMNVEIPENSKEIGTARELGDLRENAEYQYGKDKQKNLNFLMNKLSDEVDSAQVVTPESVDTKFVSFGTKVVFLDNATGEDVTYTIFGPWESDPTKNILNFKAPLGQKLYNLEVGETTKFNINGVDYNYTVKSISLADF